MGACGIEKPMQLIGGVPVIKRVVDSMVRARSIGRILVSVSSNTPDTESYLNELGIETLRTSGDDFMNDIHDSFSVLDSEFVLMSPSDIPLMTSDVIDRTVDSFRPEMQSMIVMIDAEVVRRLGTLPSYTREIDGREWVLSGVSIMDREATLEGKWLNEECLKTDWTELAVNVNTQDELALARKMFS